LKNTFQKELVRKWTKRGRRGDFNGSTNKKVLGVPEGVFLERPGGGQSLKSFGRGRRGSKNQGSLGVKLGLLHVEGRGLVGGLWAHKKVMTPHQYLRPRQKVDGEKTGPKDFGGAGEIELQSRNNGKKKKSENGNVPAIEAGGVILGAIFLKREM